MKERSIGGIKRALETSPIIKLEYAESNSKCHESGSSAGGVAARFAAASETSVANHRRRRKINRRQLPAIFFFSNKIGVNKRERFPRAPKPKSLIITRREANR